MGVPNINIGLMVVWFKKLYGVLNLVTSLVIECVLPSLLPSSMNMGISPYHFDVKFAVREYLYVFPM